MFYIVAVDSQVIPSSLSYVGGNERLVSFRSSMHLYQTAEAAIETAKRFSRAGTFCHRHWIVRIIGNQTAIWSSRGEVK